MDKHLTFAFALFLPIFATSQSQQLTAVYCNATLHTTLSDHSIWYDGDDFVYIFGGGGYHTNGSLDANLIHRYSLAKDTLEFMGTLPGKAFFGHANSDSSGNIFYFGGRDAASRSHNEVYRFDPIANSSQLVAIHRDQNFETDPVIFKQNSSANRLTFLRTISNPNPSLGPNWYDGYEDFDMESLSFEERNISTSNNFPASAFVQFNESVAYIFKGIFGLSQVWEFNIQSLEFSRIEEAWFPTHDDSYPQAVTDRENIYIVSTFYDDNRPEINAEGIIKFSPATRETSFLHVDNWPIKADTGFYLPPKIVYINKLNRIYFFGGLELGNTRLGELDLIWFVDLDPPPFTQIPTSSTTLEPTSTLDPQFCTGKTNGFYPHPTNCSIFISCWDEVSLEFSCPNGYFYNPNLQTCSPSDEVECRH